MTALVKETIEKSSFLTHIKMGHVALMLIASLLGMGISIGRSETKTVEQEKRIEHVEQETRSDVQEFKDEVIRHLDALAREQRETNRRIDDGQSVIRDLAADVAVLCSKSGKGCSTR